MIQVKKIGMDYLEQPMGVIELPQFNWVVQSDKKNVKQESYRLQLSKENSFAHLLFDTEWVKSEQSAQIVLEQVPLQSATRYFVRVQISDGEEQSEWSETASFVTGLLSLAEWKAQFISAETKADFAQMNGTLVRGQFFVEEEKEIQEAYAYTTALGLYTCFLNGEKVGEDEMAPGWTSYHRRLMYQTYDITNQLKKGKNILGAMLGVGWYKGKMGFLEEINNYGMQTAFLGQLCIRYTDGTRQIVVSDECFRASDSAVLFSDIYDGEYYDSRQEQQGWATEAFDETAWRAVEIVEYDKAALVPQAGTRVKVMNELPAIKVWVTKEGDSVVDFGQNLTGRIAFKVKGKAGERVELHCFETLDANGNVYTANLRTAKQTITYICKGEEEEYYHPYFTFQGFRYAKIVSYPGVAQAENFIAQVIHSDMEETGTFACSNADLNQLQHNIVWGLKGNFLDVPTDCPQRNERLGWTGDAQIFCRTASYLKNTYTFFSKWLQDLAADQTEEGGVPHVVPDIITGKESTDWLVKQGTHSAAGWADAAVINPFMLYQTYGDKKILEQQYESMKAWITFMTEHAVDGIWTYRLQFGDWVALDAEEGSYFGATPLELTCTAYYAYSTEIMAKVAEVLAKEEDALYYKKLHASVVETFHRHFFDENGGMTAETQTAHILALYFQLTPEKWVKKTAEKLVDLLEKENGHLVTGFMGTPYFCHALSQNGYTKEAYELLLKDDFPSWLYQVKAGATTVWEHWDGMKPDGTMWSPDMNSFNHYAYGAIGEWLYRVVAGIEWEEGAQAVGYKKSIIAPHIGGGLTEVDAAFESVYGQIAVKWSVVSKEEVHLTVKIPVNTTSTIRLIGATKIIDGDGISFDLVNGILESGVGSGTYHFKYLI